MSNSIENWQRSWAVSITLLSPSRVGNVELTKKARQKIISWQDRAKTDRKAAVELIQALKKKDKKISLKNFVEEQAGVVGKELHVYREKTMMGSAIKGMLRTALLHATLLAIYEHRGSIDGYAKEGQFIHALQWMEQLQPLDWPYFKEAMLFLKSDKDWDRWVFGDPQTTPLLKALMVSDFFITDEEPDRMGKKARPQLAYLSEVNLQKAGYDAGNKKPSLNEEWLQTTPVQYTGTITWNHFEFTKYATLLRANQIAIDTVHASLKKGLLAASEFLLMQELDIVQQSISEITENRQSNGEEINRKQLGMLSEIERQLKGYLLKLQHDQVIILQLGWGAGYLSKTYGWWLDKRERIKCLRKYEKERTFVPKTRKLLQTSDQNGTAYYHELGFVEIKW